jgi:hypothetical protein
LLDVIIPGALTLRPIGENSDDDSPHPSNEE